jgi:hypothetical protein
MGRVVKQNLIGRKGRIFKQNIPGPLGLEWRLSLAKAINLIFLVNA